MRLEFGRKVAVSRIRLYTRADFPHDNWWKQVTIRFSDGSEVVAELEKAKSRTRSYSRSGLSQN